MTLGHESLGKGCSRLKRDDLGSGGYRPAKPPRICKYCGEVVLDRFAKQKRAPWHGDCREKALREARERRKMGQEDNRTVYTREEFDLLRKRGKADTSSVTGEHQVVDASGSWRTVRVIDNPREESDVHD